MTKLTLSIEPSLVEKAKQMAESNNTSVSAMFSQFVESVAARRGRRPRIGPLTRKLSGLIELPARKGYKELLADALADKYGLGK
jgi:hypothetical protein